VQYMRCPFGSCFPRWPGTKWITVLY